MRRLVAIAACALLASGAQAAPRERTDAPPLEPYKIILVGDSTMAPHSGWGGAFCAHHVKSSVQRSDFDDWSLCANWINTQVPR